MKNKMKIAIITNIPTPYRQKQWEHYSKVDNIDITVFYCSNKEQDRFWNVKPAFGIKEVFLRGIHLKDLHFNPGIFKIINKYDFFIIGGYGYPTVTLLILILNFLRKPWALMIDGISPDQLTNEKWYTNLIKRFFIKGAELYFANGTISKLYLKKYKIPGNKIFNQYMTVDINYFIEKEAEGIENRNKIRHKYGINDDSIVIMYAGRIVPNKGINDLIEATNHLNNQKYNICTLIVGDGKIKEELELQTKNSQDKVIFTGHIQPSDLYKYYYASDIFILPTHDDPWGLVVNEAMSCGLPAITTNAAGCSLDLIKGNGYTIKAGEKKELIHAIEQLTDFKLRKSYGKKSREIISNWTYEESLKSLNEMIEMIRSYVYGNRD